SPLLLVQFAVATSLFWLISSRSEKRSSTTDLAEIEPPPDFRVNLFKAAVPIVPLVSLMIVGPPLNVVAVPQHWLVEPNRLDALRPELNDAVGAAYDRWGYEAQISSFCSRLIVVSYLIGAILTT